MWKFLLCFYFFCDDVCQLLRFFQHIYKIFELLTKLIEFCNVTHEPAAPGAGFPLKSSSQERPGLVSDYRSLWTFILKLFTQRNLCRSKVFSFLETTLSDRTGGVTMALWMVSAHPGGTTLSAGRA